MIFQGATALGRVSSSLPHIIASAPLSQMIALLF
jgi:hypothetical protein